MEVCYRYDGSFEGFLCCVFDSYAHHEPPMAFRRTEDDPTLFDEREVETDPAHAGRVYKALGEKVSPAFQALVKRAFLTCLPNKELDLYTLIRRGLREGDRVRRDLSDPVMARVTLALTKMWTEWDHLKGFVRFSDLDGVLVGEIEPKNRVLSLLGPHFAGRFPGEKIVLYDRTNREILLCVRGRWTVTAAEEFRMGPAGGNEREFRALWRNYFNTIAIQGRTNPRCQSTHLPKRYRGMMTEFQSDDMGPSLPGQTTQA